MATTLPAEVHSLRSAGIGRTSIEKAQLKSKFNFYEVPQCHELRWPVLPYGSCRDVVLFYDPGGAHVEATLCDGVHCENNTYPAETRLTLDALPTFLASYQVPKVPVVSALRRKILFPKSVQIKLLAGLVSGSAKVSAVEVLWPPLHRAFRELGGGWWRENDKELTVNFFEGGIAAEYFVNKRLCTLDRGQLTVALDKAFAALPHIFQLWVKKTLTHPLADLVRQGNLGHIPGPVEPFFKGQLRKRAKLITYAESNPPRCIQHALKMPAFGLVPRAWKYPMRWDVAKVVRTYANLVGAPVADVLQELIIPAMTARGDHYSAIKEFTSHAMTGKTAPFLCKYRTKHEGLFCPIGTMACAVERNMPHNPDFMSPARVWAYKSEKKIALTASTTLKPSSTSVITKDAVTHVDRL